jgi:hypothetical protein
MDFDDGPDDFSLHRHGAKGKRKTGSRYERVLSSLKRRLGGQTGSIRIHTFVFAAVNVFLISLNATIAGGFPWSYFPLAGWAIGLLGHLRAYLNRRREVKQLEALPGLAEEPGRIVRAYQRSEGAFGQHATAFASVNAFLIGINLITAYFANNWFLWSLIPLGGWSIGFFSHLLANTARRKMLGDRLAEYGIRIGPLKKTRSLAVPAGTDFRSQAIALKEHLSKEYKDSAALKDRWAEIEPLISTFVSQIDDLEKKRDRLNQIMQSVSLPEIKQELSSLKEKHDRTAAGLLKKEYERSISQYESHLKAATELDHHREIIDLRIDSAFKILKQLEMDAARLANTDVYSEPSSLTALRSKTEEMQDFLADFQKGLAELEREL